MLLLVVNATSSVVYADENTYITLNITYSSNIEPQENDVFVITYHLQGENETADITLDASKLNNKVGKLDMPEGTYTISKIKYTGNNPEIENQGYAITEYIAVTSENNYDCNIYLAIGTEAGNALLTQNSNSFGCQNGKYADELQSVEPIVTAEATGDETTEITEEATTEEATTQEIEIIEQKEYDQPTFWGRFIPLLIITIIGAIIIYIIHKKGIL